MARLNIKRPARTEVVLSGGDKLALRPISAIDVSTLVAKFDLETVQLSARVIEHIQKGAPIGELLSDARLYVDLVNCLPDLTAEAICLSAGGDSEDLEAIRELPAEDLGILAARLVAISLERIGGLGKFLDLITEAVRLATEAFQKEVQKRQEINSSSASGEVSPS